MTELTETGLREALRDIADPATGRDIVTAGRVEGIAIRGGLVQVGLLTDREHASQMEPVRRAVEARLRREPGVVNASAVLTAAAPAPKAGAGAGAVPPSQKPKLLADVGAVIAVASGKGGVGKSTVAVNLAIALAQRGRRVGLLDADIYGPSLPIMLGLQARPDIENERMVPLEAFGLRALSIGLLVDPETAMIWRGPMVMSALEQMMGQTAWGMLDVMVIDMPPGTGDVALTLAQRVHVAGAVIVSTPQDVALIDARRAVRMFEKTQVPVLGLVENMSVFVCPHCHGESHPFGHGKARAEAARLGLEFLGEVPLEIAVRESGDSGRPIVTAGPETSAGCAFGAIAERVQAALARRPG